MKRIPKIEIGDVVEVQFLDHAEHGADAQAEVKALNFTVFGRVVEQDRRSLTVETWCYTDPAEPRDANVACFTLIKGAILKLTVLRAGQAKKVRKAPASTDTSSETPSSAAPPQ